MKFWLRSTGLMVAVLVLVLTGWVKIHRAAVGPSLIAFTREGMFNGTNTLITAPGVAWQRMIGPRTIAEAHLTWSADGKRLAFEGWLDGNIEIFSISRAGWDGRNLSQHYAFDTAPNWSPDGQWIAFNSDREGNAEIFIMHPDGSDTRNISNFAGRDYDPAWSPDGKQIAYVSVRGGLPQIYRTCVAGGEPQWLSRGFSPTWSPDGKRIAFVYELNRDNQDVYVMRADGTGIENLSARWGFDLGPVWSPDGQWVAFAAAYGTQYELCKVRIGSTDLHCMAQHPGHDLSPSWSPNGEWIAFISTRSGNRDVFAVRPDGSQLINVSAWSGVDAYPVWSPPLHYTLGGGVAVVSGGLLAGWGMRTGWRGVRIGGGRANMQPYTTWGGSAMPIADSELNKPSNAHIVRPARQSVHAALQYWRQQPGSYEWWWLIITSNDHRYAAIRFSVLRDLLQDPDAGVHMNTPLSDLPLDQPDRPGVVAPRVVEQDAMGTARALQMLEDSPGRVLIVLKNGTLRGILSVTERTFAFTDKPLLDMLDEFESSGNDDTMILPHRPDIPPTAPDAPER